MSRVKCVCRNVIKDVNDLREEIKIKILLTKKSTALNEYILADFKLHGRKSYELIFGAHSSFCWTYRRSRYGAFKIFGLMGIIYVWMRENFQGEIYTENSIWNHQMQRKLWEARWELWISPIDIEVMSNSVIFFRIKVQYKQVQREYMNFALHGIFCEWIERKKTTHLGSGIWS